MLILFDVDATLITTSRSGIAAMGLAGRALYGDAFDESVVEYAGRLDPLIIEDLLRAHGRDVTDAEVQRFRAGYREHLARLLAHPGQAQPCPGVLNLLDALSAAPEITLGLLTGNFPETGAIKLRASGIDPDRFAVRVWGCDSPHTPPARDHLPPLGMRQYAQQRGRELAPDNVIIIGDTPHDIRCARVHGCRSLGVATGSYSVQQLDAAGADRALPDLTETQEILQWMIGQAAPR